MIECITILKCYAYVEKKIIRNHNNALIPIEKNGKKNPDKATKKRKSRQKYQFSWILWIWIMGILNMRLFMILPYWYWVFVYFGHNTIESMKTRCAPIIQRKIVWIKLIILCILLSHNRHTLSNKFVEFVRHAINNIRVWFNIRQKKMNRKQNKTSKKKSNTMR